jgi:type II secretory pathway component GspD/PulD (secretin)
VSIVVAAVVSVGSAPVTSAGDPRAGDIDVLFGEGITVRDLLAAISSRLGKPIVWDAETERWLSVQIVGSDRIRVSGKDLFATVRSIAATAGVAMVEVGTPSVAWVAIVAVRGGDGILNPISPTLISDAVPDSVLDAQHGLFAEAVVTVPDDVDVAETVAAAARLLTLTPQNVGSIIAIPTSHCLVIFDFAPVIASVRRFVRGLSAPSPRIVRAFPLEHASAIDVRAIVEKALGTMGGTRGRGPELRLTAAAASNQLIAVGSEADLGRVAAMVEALDRPAVAAPGR